MSRTPGGWMRSRIAVRRTFRDGAVGALAGVAAGTVAAQTVPPDIVLGGVAAAWAGMVLAALLRRSYSIRNLERGLAGEEAVAAEIGAAMLAPRCAAAHGVTGIDGLIGDIDHLVATPSRLWVVETKSGRLPAGRLADAMRRVESNVAAVGRWADGAPVRGCVVLARGRVEGGHQGRGNDVAVLTRRGLGDELRAEAARSGTVEPWLAERVGRLA